jgi:hypothetical protein
MQLRFYSEVFVFDREIQSILEVVVGKTLEQALTEVACETELAAIEAHRQRMLRTLEREQAAAAALLDAEADLQKRNDARVRVARERHEREKVIEKKMAALLYSKKYVSQIRNQAFNKLTTSGFFVDPARMHAEEFVP